MFTFKTNVIKEAKSSCLIEEKNNIVITSLFLEEKTEIENHLLIKISKLNSEENFNILEKILSDSFCQVFCDKPVKTKLIVNVFIFSGDDSFNNLVNSISICLLQSGFDFSDFLVGLSFFNCNFIYKIISNEIIYFNGISTVEPIEFDKKIEEYKEIIKKQLI